MNKGRAHAISDFLTRGQLLVLRGRMVLTWLSLFWESFIPAIWPIAGVVLVFGGLALAGVPAMLPGLLHLAWLVLSGLALAVAAFWFVRHCRLPSWTKTLTRLETAGHVLHRPLTGASDTQALGRNDPASTVLWHMAMRRRAGDIALLRPPPPDTGMTGRDPLGLRAGVLIVMGLGLVVGHDTAGDRLKQAFSPQLSAAASVPESLEAWITPPTYTGLAPIYLGAGNGGTGVQDTDRAGAPSVAPVVVPVPVNSILLARYAGDDTPVLRLESGDVAFTPQGGGSFKAEQVLKQGHRLEFFADGRLLNSWPIRIVPDKAPVVRVDTEPAQTVRGAFTMGFTAADDYGLHRSWISLKPLVQNTSPLLAGQTRRIDLPRHDGAPRSLTETVFRDLSDDLLAGQLVQIVAHAEDMAGNVGSSEPMEYRLPVRKFAHPVAKALSEQRRKLIMAPLANREWVKKAVSALQINPDLYDGDFAAHLIMGLAGASLNRLDSAQDAVPSLAHLWAAALRVEDGQLAVAQRKMRDLQQKLAEALAEGADQETIDQLMGELRQAMGEYLQALQQRAQRDGGQAGDADGDQDTRTVRQQTLEDMLRKAEELSRAGNRDQARNMLNQLQKMLENLQAKPGTRKAGKSPARDALKELGTLMERQRDLQDKTFNRDQQSRDAQRNAERNRRLRGGGQGNESFEPNQRRGGEQQGQSPQRGARRNKAGESVGADGDLAAQQRQLSRQLGKLMDRLGESLEEGVPEAFDRAREAMRRSENALRRQNRSGAMREQTRSLQNLQRGLRSVIQSLADENGDGEPGESGRGRAGMDGEQPDPLGRSPIDSFSDNSKQVIPDSGVLQKSRRILDELRKRSSEPARPSVERDYIDRLLEPF